MSCRNPQATKRVINPGTGPRAWCPQCQTWAPAEQVPWSRMRRNKRGEVTATFAPKPHTYGQALTPQVVAS